MARSPHSARSPMSGNLAEASIDPMTSTDEDEITPIINAGHDRSRSYQTTVLHTHTEASEESSAAEAAASGKPARREGGGSTKTTGASPKPASLIESVRRGRRKLRQSNSMRPTSDSGPAVPADGSGEDNDDDAYAGQGGRLSQWWRGVADKYGSVELDNKGSVARDHLALERTFLAWLRTSLSFASIGIAITQLFRLNTTITDREGLQPKEPGDIVRLRQMGKPLGAVFLAIAIIVLLVGSRRYFESQHWIIRGKFPASRGSVILVTFVAVSLIVASLAIVLVVSPTQFEN